MAFEAPLKSPTRQLDDRSEVTAPATSLVEEVASNPRATASTSASSSAARRSAGCVISRTPGAVPRDRWASWPAPRSPLRGALRIIEPGQIVVDRLGNPRPQ